MGVRLLFVGDMHLGRRPSRLPEVLSEYGLGAGHLGPAAAWSETVGWAIEHRVDAVVLTGDVIDRDDDRFEAYGHLERGTSRLAEAGITVCGVAGNHDVEALPRLARRLPSFHLLGAGGRWESFLVEGACGRARVRLLGWSFPTRQFGEDPLQGLEPGSGEGCATIGVLHCDLDAASSPYAPVSRASLEGFPLDAWLLGHVHVPSDLSSRRPIGYLGSLVGLDASETGVHGPWLAEVGEDSRVRMTQIPLAPLRWERIDLPAGSFDEVDSDLLDDAIGSALTDAFARMHAKLAGASAVPRAVACRIRFHGRARRHRRLARALAAPVHLAHCRACDSTTYFVERLQDDSAPEIDLARLAQSADPPGLLARRLLQLTDEASEPADWVQRVRASLQEVAERNTAWRALAETSRGSLDTRTLLLRAGMDVLEELLAQGGREPGAAAP